MARVAQCQCGKVKLTCQSEPAPVILCSCQLCQKRTGSPFQIGAWFDMDKVSFEGETKEFTRNTGDLGMDVTFNLCPQCGTSIWWGGHAEGPFAGMVAIAGGCFADADFPPPTIAVYDKHRQPWISLPAGIPVFDEVPDLEGIENLSKD